MIAQIIHDNRRSEKYDQLAAEMIRQGISYVIWSAEILETVVASINASHRKIVRWAKETGLTSVLIMEDDVYFPAPDGFKHFIKNIPRHFDMYLGGCYSHIIHCVNGSYASRKGFVGAHCYMIHESFYDRFLNTDPNLHIDAAQQSAHIRVCYPMAAIQRPGWSANNGSEVNYNQLLNPADVYGGIPKNYDSQNR